MLKMEAICSSETSGGLRTTLRYNPEDGILQAIIGFPGSSYAHQPQLILLLAQSPSTHVFVCCFLSLFFLVLLMTQTPSPRTQLLNPPPNTCGSEH
jgi:hypothetical protein